MIKNCLFLIILSLFSNLLLGQEEGAREGNFFAVGVSYGLQFAAGDLADRFGQGYQANLSLDWFKDKFNGSYGVEGFLLFGDKVNEDILAPLRLENTAILGVDGRYADVFLRQRGNYLGGYVRKIILPLKRNRRTGLSALFGVGLLQHKIRVQVDTNNAPNLTDEYVKGYDRHSVGPALRQALGYTHVDKVNNVNFSVNLEITEAFTSSSRAFNFDTFEKPEGTRLDMVIGFNFKWFIPLKDQRSSEDIYY